MQRSGIDAIKYPTWPWTLYGKVTKTQENITYKSAKRSGDHYKTAMNRQESIKNDT